MLNVTVPPSGLEDDNAAKPMSDTVEGGGDVQRELTRAPLMFDPWLTTSSALPGALAENIAYAYADSIAPRRRRLKPEEQQNLDTVIGAILVNLAYAVACGHEPPTLAVSLRAAKQKLTRYDRRGFAILPKVLEALSGYAGGAILSLRKSTKKGVASIVTAPPPLFRLHSGGKSLIRPGEFRRDARAETIILSRTTRDYIEDSRTVELIDYRDTSETERYRAEMAAINAFLAGARMTIEPDTTPPARLGQRYLERHFKLLPDDPEDSPRFDQCGRLFKGWWQNMKREQRGSIRLEGEPIADLDFRNMFLRLAYLEAGAEPPPADVDLYSIIPGLGEPQWREGAKLIVNAMLCRSTPMQRMPRDPGLKEKLPPGMTAGRIREAVLMAHAPAASVFESGRGLHLMFTESQILVAAMLRLVDAGIVALPMHDGLMVPASKAEAAREHMENAAEDVAGFRLPVVQKNTITPQSAPT